MQIAVKLPQSQKEHTSSLPLKPKQPLLSTHSYMEKSLLSVILQKSSGKKSKDSSVSTWKKKYSAEFKRVISECDSEEQSEVQIKSLPFNKRGRPLLLGEELDTAVKNYIKAVCDASGVINTSITIAVATATVRKTDRNLLSENGCPITITTHRAKSLLH